MQDPIGSGSDLPLARGPNSEAVIAKLGGAGGSINLVEPDDALRDDDLHLALYLCYELSYRGVSLGDDRFEWDPALIRFRLQAETAFESSLHVAASPPETVATSVPEVLRALAPGSPSGLARYLARDATLERFREFLIHRSAYHLKEADPHTWVIPRLAGRAKAALVEIQADEYGGGNEARMHATLFSDMMRELGLDPTYGRYLDLLPGSTLATVNLMSMFGLNRRLRGAAVGHLAAFELGSSIPNREYARGLRRLGYEGRACRFFDEHVVADAVHDMVATYDLAGTLALAEPALAGDILFGAAALDVVEDRFAKHLLDTWRAGKTSLYPAPAAAAAG